MSQNLSKESANNCVITTTIRHMASQISRSSEKPNCFDDMNKPILAYEAKKYSASNARATSRNKQDY
ncbi:hypothetical protein PanWU01x14_078140 [Parasponia andersonii]|uniref:Uncharacterized protein n=1 Tax=Parasponia andersonii TaxID=3476 RepID=A0A2P5DBX0_PARAD|nr:hypothetical protein PanWU01x14_078140 [Parasponia andersonii]